MTTSDITLKINADEKGAVAGLRRLRSEVLNNEKGLDGLARQGKMTGTALKDAAGMLGPEFQILGDRIDHITGALGDIKGAGLMAKASLVALVAAGGFEVGQMIGNWVFETEKWKESLAAAREEADRLNSKLLAGAKERAATLSDEQMQQETSGAKQQVNELGDQISKLRAEAEAWTIANVSGFGVNERKEEIATLVQEREAARATVEMYREAGEQREKLAEQTKAAEEAKAMEKEQHAADKAREEIEQLNATQADYLSNLEMELVKIKEGEEAYLRLTLAKQGFNEETINSALALKAEITELSELDKERQKTKTEKDSAGRLTSPGVVQATETRGLTRGIGMKDEQKILAETQKQTAKTAELVTVNKQLLAAIKAIKVA
jgi:hypothetical protein